MAMYRGWKIYGGTAYRSGTTIYGDNLADAKRRIDALILRETIGIVYS
jgi:hypothetical protein